MHIKRKPGQEPLGLETCTQQALQDTGICAAREVERGGPVGAAGGSASRPLSMRLGDGFGARQQASNIHVVWGAKSRCEPANNFAHHQAQLRQALMRSAPPPDAAPDPAAPPPAAAGAARPCRRACAPASSRAGTRGCRRRAGREGGTWPCMHAWAIRAAGIEKWYDLVTQGTAIPVCSAAGCPRGSTRRTQRPQHCIRPRHCNITPAPPAQPAHLQKAAARQPPHFFSARLGRPQPLQAGRGR